MNRIYQGRVSKVEILDGAKKNPAVLKTFTAKDLESQANPLWEHHEIFQDAVNYYLVALAALASGVDLSGRLISPHERLAKDLLLRVEASWDRFPKSVPGPVKPRALRDSLRKWLGLDGSATLTDAFDVILHGNPSAPDLRLLGLQLLLNKCGGESAIQQEGRNYLPKLCVAINTDGKPYSGSWDYDAVAQDSDAGKDRLAEVLHGEPSIQSIEGLALEMEIQWAGIKCKAGESLTGENLKKRLQTALEHQIKRFGSSQTAAEKDFIQKHPSAMDELRGLISRVTDLPDEMDLPVNKGGNISWDLVHSAYLFKVFPSLVTAGILSLSVKKPANRAKSAKSKQGADYARFGDDPIKLCRGTRGYVFPAFTALPCWNPTAPGMPVWKEFDIAAFKEALKSLNQFNQKTMEREETRAYLRGRIAILLGSEVKGWKPRNTDAGEPEARPDALNQDLLARSRKLESRLTEQLADTVVDYDGAKNHAFGDAVLTLIPGQWQLSVSALRGFRDIAPEWNKLAEKKGESLTSGDLQEAVKDHQQQEKNRKQLGSVPLFLMLCEREFWPLWRKADDSSTEEETEYNRFLFRYLGLHADVRDYLRSLNPINLTPAEPRHSRRLYMFSDVEKKEKMFKPDGTIEVTLAYLEGGVCVKKPARLGFTAPRLRRDELTGGTESRWLQPMVAALGLTPPESQARFISAVSLMPDFSNSGDCRLLLNFPTTLEAGWLHEQIGKDALWNGQFNGVKDKNIHLHWPQNEPKTKQVTANPWWKNPVVLANGFTILSVDLGQRTAGAWALLRITPHTPASKKPVRRIGHDGSREWFAEVLQTGMFRLPGEDQKVRGKDGQLARELSGKAGRSASADEYEVALGLARRLGAENPERWIGGHPEAQRPEFRDVEAKSMPEQYDSILALANRRLSRLATFHRWSCFAANLEKQAADPVRRQGLIDRLREELEHWEDQQVRKWKELVENGFIKEFSESAGMEFEDYRDELGSILVELANRIAPLRGKVWKWKLRGGGSCYGELEWEEIPNEKSPNIRGQRGLSMERLEQLEGLRKLFLRYNRSLDKKPAQPAKVGFGFQHDSGEPCPQLLEKIDRMKEQRINLTAHHILAQALGVRLREHQFTAEERESRDIHGEYEVIPDRKPVDFIVMENLDRYLTSQGRAPSENRRLMKWAHRAVRDKLKMLAEEPFGIPLVEAAAAYSSRFCAKAGHPGMRCEERPALDTYLREQLEKKAKTLPAKGRADHREIYRSLLEQFAALEKHNADRKADNPKKMLRTLLLPKAGGSLFLPVLGSGIVQADANAAINIGLRAVAAPESIDLLHKIRTERKKEKDAIIPQKNNAREKAAFKEDSKIEAIKEFSNKVTSAPKPNFFHLSDEAAAHYGFDQATLEMKGRTLKLVSGVAFHSLTEDLALKRIVAMNDTRLSLYGICIETMRESCLDQGDPDDDIPM